MKIKLKNGVSINILFIVIPVIIVLLIVGYFIYQDFRKSSNQVENTTEDTKIEYSVREMSNEEYLEIGKQALSNVNEDLNDNQKKNIESSAIYEAIFKNEAEGYMNTLKITDTEKREYVNTHDVSISKVKVNESGQTIDYLLDSEEEDSNATYRDPEDQDYLDYAEREIVSLLTVKYVNDKVTEVMSNDTNR